MTTIETAADRLRVLADVSQAFASVVMTAVHRASEAAASLAADGSLPEPIKLRALLSLVNRYSRAGTGSPPGSDGP